MNIILNYVQRTFRVYWYNVSDVTDICAEYTFRYTLTGDYITGMTIEEKINPREWCNCGK